jgi:hypothetical protein
LFDFEDFAISGLIFEDVLIRMESMRKEEDMGYA